MGETDHHVHCVVRLHLEEVAIVDDHCNHVLDVVGLFGIVRKDRGQAGRGPSWIGSPPDSFIPMIVIRLLSARSMTLITFSAKTSPSEPPKTLASWLNSITSRPSILAMPLTTPSPGTPAGCLANRSISSNELRSTRREIRSRAVSLPFACCLVNASASPWPASYLRWRSSLSGSILRGGRWLTSGAARPGWDFLIA